MKSHANFTTKLPYITYLFHMFDRLYSRTLKSNRNHCKFILTKYQFPYKDIQLSLKQQKEKRKEKRIQ